MIVNRPDACSESSAEPSRLSSMSCGTLGRARPSPWCASWRSRVVKTRRFSLDSAADSGFFSKRSNNLALRRNRSRRD